MKKTSLIAFALLLTAASALPQATTTVDWRNFSFSPATQNSLLFRNAAGTPLSQGTANLNTDGFLVQLGYFSNATPGSNFSGTWIPLTGTGATLHTTIGDSFDLTGSGNGIIAFNTFFTLNTSVVQVYDPVADSGRYVTQSSVPITTTTPPNNQVLSIRFYDSASNTSFNTVSANDWLWQTPSTTGGGPIVTLDLESAFLGLGSPAAAPLVWESIQVFGMTGTEFRTVLIPEPSTYALLVVGVAAVVLGGRRLKRAA